jgi:hypothetical protein
MLAGCGVRYSDPEKGTEFYESMTVSGERRAGETLTVVATYTQTYPLEVESVCELRQDKQTLKEIGRTLVPLLPGGNPDATPTVGELRYEFTVDAPGVYKVECLTPKDEDNFIDEEITVS